ncbi:MAG: GGDEF domain-containing protein [Planctomycetota bacterium]
MDGERASSPGVGMPLLNYSQFLHLLKVEFDRAKRYETPLSCLRLEIDRLDHLADIHGLGARRFLFDSVVQLLGVETRSCDFIGRYDDLGIAILLPQTDVRGAETLARRIQERVTNYEFDIQGTPIQISFSIGVASYYRKSSLFHDAVLKAADQAARDARRSGGRTIAVDEKSRELTDDRGAESGRES